MNTLLTQLEQQARSNPASIAIRSGDESLTYAQLITAVQQTVEQLKGNRVKSLGLYLDNGIAWIVVDLAAMAATIRIVPLPWFFSDEQISHAIQNGAVDALVFATEAPSGIVGTGSPVRLYKGSQLQSIKPRASQSAVTASIVGKVSYTSGSTGKPKGIELDYAFIDQTCHSISAAISELGIETHLSILPYATLLENIAGVYVPLMLGKTVYAESSARVGLSADLRLDPAKLQQTFNQIRPNSLIITPQLLELFCMLVETNTIDPECLVFVAVGGARVGEALMHRARRAGIPAYEGYGLTEFGSVAILNTPQQDRVGSVGKPLPGVVVKLAEDGEICLGTTLMQAENDSSRPETITVKTGDLGSIDGDGFIYVHGRKSNLIVLSTGRNVAPEWVETELNASAMILQSYVFTETNSELSALLVAAGPGIMDGDLDLEIDRINATLPSYAQVKNWYRLSDPFSRANQMLTTNGRLRRLQIKKVLPALLASAQSFTPITAGDLSSYSLREMNQ
jgi:long-subunit acyl-CoA synthetase (AMP-forming)